MAFRDLREFIAALEEAGQLKRVRVPVDPILEVAEITDRVSKRGGPALLFEQVKGSALPLVINAFGSPERMCLALGVKAVEEVAAELEGLLETKAPQGLLDKLKLLPKLKDLASFFPKMVKDGPCKEVIRTADASLDFLPVIQCWPQDAGRYITFPLVITKDPETGIQNMGNYRMQLKGKDMTAMQVFPNQHVGLHLQKWQARKQNMPVCVCIGVDPTVSMSAVAKVPYGVDELTISGALRGAPIEVVKAETCDLLVPARAQYILEGEIAYDEEIDEGPFGEYAGYMGLPTPKKIFRVKCVTRRRQPIYQAYISQIAPSESCTIQQEAIGAMMYKHLALDLKIPGIKDVYFTEASAKAWLIIQMKPLYPGHSKKVMVIASNLLDANCPKMVTVVDDDIDIRDPWAVEWATTFRVDPAYDVQIVQDTETIILDPTTMDISGEGRARHLRERVTGSKLLIDATLKKTYPDISLPTRDLMMKALENWRETGLPPITPQKRTLLLLEKHPGNQGLYWDPFKG